MEGGSVYLYLAIYVKYTAKIMLRDDTSMQVRYLYIYVYSTLYHLKSQWDFCGVVLESGILSSTRIQLFYIFKSWLVWV